MSTEASISDVNFTWCGKAWTLNANWEAVARIEHETGEAYPVVFARMGGGIPRLVDVTTAFAAFALPHGKHSATSIRAIMPFDQGQSLIEAYQHVEKAIIAAQPKEAVKEAAPGTEGSGQQQADPR